MNKIFYIVVTCIIFALLSCNNEEKENMTDIVSVGNSNEIYSPQYFAKALALALNDESLRDFIKEEAMKQKDGDYDVLIAEVLDKQVGSGVSVRLGDMKTFTLREHLERNEMAAMRSTESGSASSITMTSVLRDIDKNYPSLQIAVPNMENASWKDVVSGGSPFFVAFLHKDYKEGDDVVAYDQNGERHVLDGQEEPKTPVIVISQSERIIAIPASAEIPQEYTALSVYYKNDSYTYLSEEYKKGEKNSLDLRFYQESHSISKAKFASQSAMRRYEPWTKGRPEVCVIVSNNVDYVENEFSDKGWWDGNTNNLNYHFSLSTRGEQRPLLATVCIWYEKDFVIDFSKIWGRNPNATAGPFYFYNKNNIKLGVILSPTLLRLLEDHNDYIGNNLIVNKDSNGKLVAIHPVHANDFFFWIN